MTAKRSEIDRRLSLPPALDAHGNPRPAPAAPAKPSPTKRKARHGGRFEVLNAFVDASMADLTRAELAVWLVLWRDERGGTARTGQADIAGRAGISRVTVARAIRALERRGLLKVVYQGGIGRGCSRYKVTACL